MQGEPAAVVLAAGSGRRLSPLTSLLPKALCPVANVAMLDHAIGFASTVTSSIAVNAWHQAGAIARHVEGRAHVSVETGEALGTAGGVAALAPWIDGRDVMICNADAWHDADLRAMYAAWDGESPMLLMNSRAKKVDFDGKGFAGASLLPWSYVKRLRPEPSGLWEVCWRAARERGELRTFDYDGRFFDCGTPGDYLQANLEIAGTDSVVAETATVDGEIDRCVLWDGVRVEKSETLRHCIRPSQAITIYVPEAATNGDRK